MNDVTSVADQICRELGEPIDLTIPVIAFWRRDLLSLRQNVVVYNKSNIMPVVFLEEHYECENVGGELGTVKVLRRQEYRSLRWQHSGEM